MTPPLRLRIVVAAAPEPGLLRPAIERRLAGDVFPSATEDAVGRAVAVAVATAAARHEDDGRSDGRATWR